MVRMQKTKEKEEKRMVLIMILKLWMKSAQSKSTSDNQIYFRRHENIWIRNVINDLGIVNFENLKN